MPERTRKLAQNRIADHHRRELPAREHIVSDREGLAREVLDDALVEALVAPAQEGQCRLQRKFLHIALVQYSPAWRKRNHTPSIANASPVHPVVGAERSVHHIDAQHHARATPARCVVHLAAAEWGVLAEVHALQLGSLLERVAHVTLGSEPPEPLGKQGEDVDLHLYSPRAMSSI